MEQSTFQIVCDGSCDLSLSLLMRQNIVIVPYYISFDGKHYMKEATELPVREFYQRLVDYPDQFPKTSMPTIQDYRDAFEPYAAVGRPVLCVCMTAKFSGSFQAAQIARSMTLEAFPDAKICVLDSTFASGLEGMFVQEAARMRDDGLSLEEAAEELEKLRPSGRVFFTIGNMAYLIKGGRAGKLAGRIIDRIDIKPVVCLKKGEIYPAGIQHTRLAAEARVMALAEQYLLALEDGVEHYQVATGYGYSPEEGETFRQRTMIRLAEHFALPDLPNYQIGATIGTHAGPYPLGIGILRRYQSRNTGEV